MPGGLKRACTRIAVRLIRDGDFRASAGIYLGMAGNFAYALLRAISGLCSASAWLLSSAVYFALLGFLRARLARVYQQTDGKALTVLSCRCYRQTAWLIFILILPMGGMILQLLAHPAKPYPWHTIYAAACYTFCMLTRALVQLLRRSHRGSPVMSAVLALRLIAALMSLLGLQNALISQFSPDSTRYRIFMNLLTGAGVFLSVNIIAVRMLIQSARMKRELNADEQG